MNVVFYLAAFLVSYLIGGLNASILYSKFKHTEDIRTLGSKNAGTTNVLRVFGRLPAAFTLIWDIAKAVIAVLAARLIFRSDEAACVWACQGAAFGVVAGHCFPVYFGFRGGKGVTAYLGAMLVINPYAALLGLALFIVLVAITRYVSLGSVSGCLSYPVWVAVLGYASVYGSHIPLNIALALLPALLIAIQHRGNIKRLLTGTERKLSFSKRPPEQEKKEENTEIGR